MKTKICVLFALLIPLSGCIVTPRIEISDTINFDSIPPEQKTVSFNDDLCCWRCNA